MMTGFAVSQDSLFRSVFGVSQIFTHADSTPYLRFNYELWGAPSEIDDVTGTRQFTYRESIDLLLQAFLDQLNQFK